MSEEKKEFTAESVKAKVDEAIKECWDIMGKKALEAGLENNSKDIWLFYNRVCNSHFSFINNVRMKVVMDTMFDKIPGIQPEEPK